MRQLPRVVAPSYPAPSLEELLRVGLALRGVAQEFQVDLVDGTFVTAVSWPFCDHTTPASEALAALAPLADYYALEMDCMVMEPAQYFAAFASLGVKRVVIHYGSTSDLAGTLTLARGYGFTAGLALTNDVPLSVLDDYLSQLQFVQLMGIATVGAQGQPFDERTLERVRELRTLHPALSIAIDGAVNADTIPLLTDAGADRLLPGSAITRAADPLAAYRELYALAAD